MTVRSILILASSGTLAKHIVSRAIEIFGAKSVIISDYKPDRLKKYKQEIDEKYNTNIRSRVIDISSADEVDNGVKDVAFVVVPVAQREPLVQRVCIKNKVTCIDLSVSKQFIDQVIHLDGSAKENASLCLVAAGLFPGLSGILAKNVSLGQDGVIDIGLVQSTNGLAGSTGITDMLRIFSSSVTLVDKDHQHEKRGFSHTKTFKEIAHEKPYRLRLSNFVECDYLKEKGILSNYWSGFDSEIFNLAIAALQKMRFFRLLENDAFAQKIGMFIAQGKKKPKNETIILLGESSKKKVYLEFTSDYLATAECVCIFIGLIVDFKSNVHGVFFPYELFSFESVISSVHLESNTSKNMSY
jgi:saccharopine dehydrogenase-like NADP-dependent oxidoreductase